MDGWPAIETDAGRAVMKTPATLAGTFVYSGAAVASGNHTISRAVDNHLVLRYSK